MKYLSGDFVAEYNRALKELKEKQDSLDEEYTKTVNSLVKREMTRLDAIAHMPFNIGDKVRLVDRSISGIVVSCPVNLDMYHDYSASEPKYGPGRFFPLNTDTHETVVTCDGDLRKVLVSIESDELSKDWGLESSTVEYWPDELELDD